MATLFPLLCYVIAGILLHKTLGFYDSSASVYTCGFLACAGVMFIGGRWAMLSGRWLSLTVAAAHALFCYVLSTNVLLVNANDADGVHYLALLTSATLALSVPVLLLTMEETLQGGALAAFRISAVGTLALLFAAECLVPRASSHPKIDVWINNTAATDYLLGGVNPYAGTYPDIYQGLFGYQPGFLYLPGPLLLYAPIRFAGGDIRYMHALATLVAAAGLFAVATQRRLPEAQRWLFPIAWMSFPATYYVIEEAWVDPLLVPVLAWIAWTLERQDWIWTGVLLGLAVTFKQYAFVFAGPAAVLAFRQGGWPAVSRLALAATTVSVCIVAPFAVGHWAMFYSSTIGGHVNAPFRPDAFNMTTFLYHQFNWLLPGSARVAIAVTGGIAAMTWVAFAPKPQARDWAGATFLALGLAMLFGKWAFGNYHYLLASFILVYLVCASPAQRLIAPAATRRPGGRSRGPRRRH